MTSACEKPRLVMVGGVSPGIGKSTLSSAIAGALEQRGESVAFIEELACLDLPDIADAFRTKNFPGPAQLLDAFRRLLESAPDSDWIVHDGCWVPLAEDLPWAQDSWDAIVGFARDLKRVTDDYRPIVFFLHGDLAEARGRQLARDGYEKVDAYVSYVRSFTPLRQWRDAEPLALAQAYANRLRSIWTDAGWELVDISADGSPTDVLKRALDALSRC